MAASYRDLRVWQRAMDLLVTVYRATKKLPTEERYGLQSQTRRAAVSIPSNIAEGQGRWHPREFLYSLSVAESSLQELETQIEAMIRLGFATREEMKEPFQQADDVGRMLAGLIGTLRRRLEPDLTRHAQRATPHPTRGSRAKPPLHRTI